MQKKPWFRLHISKLCNFSCKNCHVFKISKNSPSKLLMDYETMDLAIIKYIKILKLNKTKNLQISIYGGEPLLNKKNLFRLIEKYQNNYAGILIDWWVNTNGSLLTESDIIFFKKYNIDIHLSCDGYAEVNDKNRIDKAGLGTFERIQKALELIKKYQAKAQLNSFAMPENINNLKDIIDIAEKFGIKAVHIDFFYAKKLMNGEAVAEKWFEVYQYGKSKDILVFGPHTDVINNYFNHRRAQLLEVPSLEVDVDGRWRFVRLPLDRERKLFELSDLRAKLVLREYEKLFAQSKQYLEVKCQYCVLKEFCLGKAIDQYQYHTQKVDGYGEVCNFIKKMAGKMSGENNIRTVQIAITYECNKKCHYCYARELKNFYQEMKLADFEKILNWLEQNNIKEFNLTGGEATLHSRFEEFVDSAVRRGFKVGLFTNGLFPGKSYKVLKKIKKFLVNYNSKNYYTKQEFNLLNKNLLKLKQERKEVNLMFNITDIIVTADHIVEAVKKYFVKEVLMDFIIPNAFKSNNFIKVESFKKKKRLFLGFLKQLQKEGIKTRISRPMPKCLFTKKELDWLERSGAVRFECWPGDSVIAINPNLSVFPCLSVFLKGPSLLSLADVKSYKDYYRQAINGLKWSRPLFEKCRSCSYFKKSECQGACLGYKCRQFFMTDNEKYVIFSQHQINKIGKFIDSLDNILSFLNKIFGKMDKSLKIFLFRDKEDFRIYSGLFDYPDWVCASTFPADFEYYQYARLPKQLLIEGLLHEMAHFYIQYFCHGKPPNWLVEGFCEFINFYSQDNQDKLLKLMEEKQLRPFKDLASAGRLSLLAHDQDIISNNICYQQAHHFVRYLVRKMGREGLMKLILGEYGDFYQYFRELTGFDFFAVEQEWKASLTGRRGY